jgi:small subunit ribosomal protein S16
MALKIRLSRGGSKKRPFYKIVIAENSSPRDGRFVERVGSYNPLLAQDNAERIVLKEERIKHWLSVGALPTERVALFLQKSGIMPQQQRTVRPTKSAPKAKAQERIKDEAKKAAAAEEAKQAQEV